MADDKLKITWEDTRDPRVDAELAREKQERAWRPPSSPGPVPQTTTHPQAKVYGSIASQSGVGSGTKAPKLAYSTPVYTCLAGLVGALVGWAITEAVVVGMWRATPSSMGDVLRQMAIWFSVIGAAVGLSVGAIEGIVCRSQDHALKGAGIGLLIGLIGCGIGGILAQLVYSGILSGCGQISLGPVMLARTIGWGIAGAFLGLGQGVAMASGKKTLNGLLGGLGGGLVGGLLFDPIGMAFGDIRQGLVSRFVGLLVIGGAAGLLIGLVEQMLKDAWLVVEQGFLVGKQFVIYKNPTLVGSSPKCHIYLFKDPAVEAQHAAIHTVGNQYEIEDLRSRQGTFVNNVPVSRARLRNGDQIRIGQTFFRYSEKRRGGQ